MPRDIQLSTPIANRVACRHIVRFAFRARLLADIITLQEIFRGSGQGQGSLFELQQLEKTLDTSSSCKNLARPKNWRGSQAAI